MNEKAPFTLKGLEPQDVEDLYPILEKSFGIKFARDALQDVATFGDVCKAVGSAIWQRQEDSCTAQQAFYKLRETIVRVLGVDRKAVTPRTRWDELLPRRRGRPGKVRKLERALGVRLQLLHSKRWVGRFILVFFVLSFICLFIRWRFGLSGLVLSFAGVAVFASSANELGADRVSDTVGYFVRDHYWKARRHPRTVNRAEIVPVVKEIFRHWLDIEPGELTQETRLF